MYGNLNVENGTAASRTGEAKERASLLVEREERQVCVSCLSSRSRWVLYFAAEREVPRDRVCSNGTQVY